MYCLPLGSGKLYSTFLGGVFSFKLKNTYFDLPHKSLAEPRCCERAQSCFVVVCLFLVNDRHLMKAWDLERLPEC